MKRTETIKRTTVLLSIISSSSNKHSIAEDGFSFVHGTRRMQTGGRVRQERGSRQGRRLAFFSLFFFYIRISAG